LSGYRLALQLSGIPFDPSIVRRELQSEFDAERAIVEIMASKSPPSAVFAAHNRLTKGVVKGLRTMTVENSIALVGFDDFELAYLLQPAVTVVAQDSATIGRIGAETLFKRIHGDTSPVATQIVQTRLIQRGSGEISASRAQRSAIR
jgi:LacI family transcriptional regulator